MSRGHSKKRERAIWACGSPRLSPADGPQSEDCARTKFAVETAAIRISIRNSFPRLCGHIRLRSLSFITFCSLMSQRTSLVGEADMRRGCGHDADGLAKCG